MTNKDREQFNNYIIKLWRTAMNTEDIESARIYGTYLATQGYTRTSLERLENNTTDVQF